ncbi:MAG: ComEC/Rec2 family competence protein [Armatimonadota bacterium]|nr:ComEC/Rec2 family competence protein [Armatimonadota bacterium]
MKLQNRPLFIFSSIYIASIVCAVQTRISLLAGLWAALCILILTLVIPPVLIPRRISVLLGLVFMVGFVRTSIYLKVPADDVSRFAEGKLVHLTGQIVSEPESYGDKTRFVLKAEKIKTYTAESKADGKVMVTAYHRKDEPRSLLTPFYGQTVSIHGRFRRSFSPSNPGLMNYERYLARMQIYSVLSTCDGDITINKQANGGLIATILCFKDSLIAKTMEIFPLVEGQLLLSILLGNYLFLPEDIQVAFMRSGTMHLLAASGYNCAVIITIFGWLMIRLTIPRLWRHLIMIASAWGFTLLAGASPSIVRAAIMVTVYLLSYIFWKPTDLPNVVMLAGLIITGLNPLNLYQIGFQLSFAAVLAIVLVMPLLEPAANNILGQPKARDATRGTFLDRLVFFGARSIICAVLLSVAATLGTAPIVAYYFNYFSLVSLIANALAAILVLILTASGIAALLVGFLIPPFGHIAATLPSWIAAVMLSVVGEIGGQSWSLVSVSSPSLVFFVFYYVALLGVLEYAHRKIVYSQKQSRFN